MKFGADLTQLKAGFAEAKGEAEQSSSGIGQFGTVAALGITAAVGAVAAFSIKSFETINTAETSLIRTTNTTGVAADQLKKSFTNVLGTVPQDAATVSSVMSVVVDKLHLSGTALESVTKQGLDMSRMLGVDAPTAVTGLTKAMNSFNLPASQAGNVMDQLYVVATKTGVPINDLTSTLAKSGAVAQSAHVPMTDYTAVIGSLGAAGTPARQGVSILNDSVTKLQGSLGKQDVGNEWNAMMQRIATGTATSADKALLGQKNFDKLSASLGNSTTGYNALLAAQKDSAGAIEKQSTATETLGEKLDIFKNKAETAFAPLGKVLVDVLSNALDAVTPLLGALTSLMTIFSNMPAPVQLIVVAIAGIAAAVGPILVVLPMLSAGFAIIAPLITLITGALGGAAAAAWAVSIPVMGMELPLIAIIAAVAIIAIGLYLLYTRFKPFHDAVDEVIGWVKTLVSDLAKVDFSKIGSQISGALGSAGGFVASMFGNAGTAIANLMKQLYTSITTFMGGFGQWIWNAVILVFKFDVKFWTWLLNTVKTFMGGMGQWFWNAVITAFKFDTKLFQAVIDAFKTFGTALFDLVKDLGTKLWTAISTALGTFGTWLWGLISDTGTKLWGAISSALGTFGTWMWGLISNLGTLLKNDVWDKLAAFGTWFIGLIQAFGTTLKTDIWDKLAAFGTWLIGLVSSFGTTLYSDITTGVGQFGTWIAGLVSGFGHTLYSDITGGVGQFGTWLGGLVSGFGHTLYSDITSGVSAFGTYLGSLVTGVGGAVWDSIKGAIGGFGQALIDGINNAAGGLSGAFAAVFTTIHVNILGVDVTLAEGGIMNPTPGGRLAVVAEAGEAEMWVPQHRWGEDWGSLMSTLPKYGAGAIVGAANLPSGSVRSGTNTQQVTNIQYVANVSVDSENITRKVFYAYRELENYAHLGL